MRKLALSLLLLATTPVMAQLSSHTGSLVAPPPDPTAYGLEIIRAEHWRPKGATAEVVPGANATPIQDNEKGDKENSGTIANYQAMIRELEIEQGPYADDLAEAFAGLAYNYQHSGDHTQAVDSFKSAIHLTRINRGPFTEDQLPMLDAMRDSLLTEGRMEDLDPLQEYIYFVHRRGLEPGDERLLQATRDYVQWQRSAYLQDPNDGGERLLTLEKLFSDTLDTLEQQGAPAAALLQPLHGALQIAYLLDFHGGNRQPDFQIQFRQSNMPRHSAEESRLRQLQQVNYRKGLRTAKELVDAAGEAPEPARGPDGPGQLVPVGRQAGFRPQQLPGGL